MSSSFCAVIAAIPFIAFSAISIAQQKTSEWTHEINTAIEDELLKSGAPSLQIAIGHKGHVVFSSTKGLADMENRIDATDQSKYRVGSVSKWFTATAAKALIDKGVVNPDTAIQQYCPQYPKKQWDITTNNLLNHRSGIRHYVDYQEKLKDEESAQERDKLLRERDRDQLSSYTRYTNVITPLESFAQDELLFKPNSDWTYSSHGYRVLACVMQGAANTPYSRLMDELIFQKANMVNTVRDDAWKIIPHRTTGYRLDRQKNLRRADMRDTSENLPAGGHLSTATDLVLFALSLNTGIFSSTELNSGKPKPKTIGVESSWRDAIPSEEFYGYGEMFFPDKSRLWVGHTGRIAGGSAIVVLQPENDLSIAILTNAKGWNGYISFLNRLKIILEESSDLLK